jgi:hypothetical protein
MKLATRRIPQSGQTIATLAMASTVLLVLPATLADRRRVKPRAVARQIAEH